jgi:hypothetical protein
MRFLVCVATYYICVACLLLEVGWCLVSMERDGNIYVDVVIVSSRGIGVMVNVESIVGIKWPFYKSVIKLAAFILYNCSILHIYTYTE